MRPELFTDSVDNIKPPGAGLDDQIWVYHGYNGRPVLAQRHAEAGSVLPDTPPITMREVRRAVQ